MIDIYYTMKHNPSMELDFWEKVRMAAQALGVSETTFRVWKHRGEVPARHHFNLAEVARKKRIGLSYEDLNRGKS